MKFDFTTLKEKHYLHAALFCFFVFCAFLYLLIFENNSLFKEWSYSGLIAVTFYFVIAVILVWSRNDISVYHISIPSVFFLLVLGFFIYLGTFDYCIQNLSQDLSIDKESLKAGYNYINIALCGWIIGYMMSRFFFYKIQMNSRQTEENKPYIYLGWIQKRLFGFTMLWGTIGIAAFIIFFWKYVKGLPFLEGVSPNASPEMRAMVLGPAHNISVVAFNSATMAIIFSGIYLMYSKSFTRSEYR